MSEQKEQTRGQGQLLTRCISLDRATDAMLLELAEGKVSSYLRRVIAVEFGKKLERENSGASRCELVQPS